MNRIPLPGDLEVTRPDPAHLTFTGPLGSVSLHLAGADPEGVCLVRRLPSSLTLTTAHQSGRARARLGTLTSLVRQAIHGVTKGWVVSLTLLGVGFRAEKKGSAVDFKLGQSHPLVFPIPSGVRVLCVKPTHLTVYGVDRARVTQVAAQIRGLKPAEVYKGKGIRYLDEGVRLKEGKKK
jgi:large subunit ribosomal protein L6